MSEEAQKSVNPATAMAMMTLSFDQMEDSGVWDE